jgi:hypothetical protein
VWGFGFGGGSTSYYYFLFFLVVFCSWVLYVVAVCFVAGTATCR